MSITPATIDQSRLLERFLRYVSVDTTARHDAGVYPSSPGQLELGRLLVAELQAMGVTDAAQDEHGIVLGTVRAKGGNARACPTVALCAHLDTSPETTGAGVKPQVIAPYRGGDVILPGDPTRTLLVAQQPELAAAVGKAIITTDGTTLLGADDKAGIAVIMECVAYWHEHPAAKHGPVRICFTCDEEIGHGVDYLDRGRVAADVCYTLDGGGAGDIDVETFSADEAEVVVHGVNIHPSIALGRMVNALRVMGALIARLPRDGLAPEVTADRQGFLHPYQLEGGVAEARVRILLRDFETLALADYANLLHAAARECEREFPGARVEVRIRPQYRNLREGLAAEPRAVALAEQAALNLGRTATRTIIRGGTDGSLLTAKGLPTPNLSTGQHNPHSPLEWACLEEMTAAAQHVVELCRLWSQES